MATTHALAGVVLGLAVAPVAPAGGSTLALAGAVGGLVPDIDAVGAHRKDLHFPVYGTGLALALAAAVATTGSAHLAVLGVALGAGALHALSDALDGGRSVRPWAESVERAVYCHAQGRWWRPRALVPYDGAPADLGVAAILAAPVVVAGSATVRALALALLAISVPYVLLRKRLPDVADRIARRVSARPEG